MEMDRFDRLTKSLAALGTRRGLLQLLPLAGGLSAFRLTDAAAKKRKAKKTCKKRCGPCKRCKKGKCKKKRDGTACAGGTCQTGSCVAPAPIVPACGAGGSCRVFLSSKLYTGDLDGLSGADAKCQGLAAAAGLPGTYKAWLSDSSSSPISRFVPSSGPYRLVNGTSIAANWADLTDESLLAPISVTETGGDFGATFLTWTHTKIDGTPGGVANGLCANWSTNADVVQGDVGRAIHIDFQWTEFGAGGCNVPRHLYCFQQS